MTYYIYHIPNVKIGCSTNPKHRVKKQGYSSFKILETHDCIDSASDRERELQKEYGYKVDIVPYKVSVRNRQPWNDKTRFKIWEHPKLCAKGSIKNVKKMHEWHRKDNFKTCIENIKGVRKHRILSPKQEKFIKKTLFKRKNQKTPIPQGKHSTSELANMFNVATYMILKSYNRD